MVRDGCHLYHRCWIQCDLLEEDRKTYLAVQVLATVIDDSSCIGSALDLPNHWESLTSLLWRLSFPPPNTHKPYLHPRTLHKGGVDYRRSEFF